jgi:HPt (histidine-containing phosphotransfer) domain-containing protein
MADQLLNLQTVRELMAVEAKSGKPFLAGLADSFAREARAALERMRACARAGDRERLAREAHRLKGSSGSIGAERLSAECRSLERAAREGDCPGLEALIDQALRVLDESQRRMEHHFARRRAGAA